MCKDFRPHALIIKVTHILINSCTSCISYSWHSNKTHAWVDLGGGGGLGGSTPPPKMVRVVHSVKCSATNVLMYADALIYRLLVVL